MTAIGHADDSYDQIVIGAGVAGMAAALFGAMAGLKTLLIESTEFVGGTSALSAGTVWVPNSLHANKVDSGSGPDSVDKARRYLQAVTEGRGDAAVRDAFLQHGPAAIATLEQHTDVKLRPYPKHPDYESDLDGATLAGRALEPLPFDGRLLGQHFALLRPPIPEFTVLGGMMVDRTDINHLLGMRQSWASLRHSVQILTRHAIDRLSHPRGTRLVMGNALIGRLLKSLLDRQVPIWTQAKLTGLITGGDDATNTEVLGVTVEHRRCCLRLQARGGVVLASGGFNRNSELRAALLPAVLPADQGWTPSAPGHTGQAIQLALQAGAYLGEGHHEHAYWAPVSLRRRSDGSTAVFPHFVLDRAKPETLVVNHAGERFLNESVSYHRFGRAMLQQHARQACIPAYLIATADAVQRYGLGMVRPGARGKALQPFIDDGYLTAAPSLADLASQLGIPPQALQHTVERYNQLADRGHDDDFGRGSTDYQRNLGDPARQPNPNLGALRQGPFYAVKLYPGDIGASTGLASDAHARLLNAQGQPIPGLYAVGNDMQSIMGGCYPGPGITLGPGIGFAYIATEHLRQNLRNTLA